MKKNTQQIQFKVITTLILVFSIFQLVAQPNTFSYQAVIRDIDGNLISNQDIQLRLSIVDESTNNYYLEIHEITTNHYGQINVNVGDGTPESGDFATVPWGTTQLILKTAVSTDNGSNFIEMGQTPLLAVPYALFAATGNEGPAGNGIESVTDNGDGTITFNFTDGSSFTTPNLTGPLVEGDSLNMLTYDGTSWVATDVIKTDGERVAIGSNPAFSRLLVQGDTINPTEEPIFEVKNSNGNVVFAVYESGVEINIDTSTIAKRHKGGFAVGGLSTGKTEGPKYLNVTPDSVRIYIEESTSKKHKGGFAVGGLSTGKTSSNNLLHVSQDSVRVYIEESTTKRHKGGFAVGGLSTGKMAVEDYLRITRDSARIYIDNSQKGAKGGFAVGGLSTGKTENQNYFNVELDTTQTIDPSEPRILWYPVKNAFLAGQVLVESSDSVGLNSTALGYETKAIGNYSQAFGYKSRAFDDFSTAIGLEAKAIGGSSFAFGESAEALGEGSYAIGSKGLDIFGDGTGGSVNTKAVGYASISIGLGAVSIGEGALAIGICDSALGNYSIAMGHGSIASGLYSRTFGLDSKAEGNYAYAFGKNSEASAQDAISIAGNSVASGIHAVSLGAQSIASGDYSLTIGMNTIAEEGASVAMGMDTRASGWGSVTMGYNTIAKPRTLLVIGRNNDTTCISEGFGWWNSLDPAFIIGNGSDENNRSNAFTVLQNGNTAIGHESPTEMLDVDGNARFRVVSTGIYANDLCITSDGTLTTQSSDKRLKTNLAPLNNSLEKVLKLNGYTFDWKSEDEKKSDVGLIAQEVHNVFPQAVFVNPNDGYFGINYSRFTALFVEAIKDQNQNIEQQRIEIDQLKKENKALKSLIKSQKELYELLLKKVSELE